jgi:CheY-like chemotaxis protein
MTQSGWAPSGLDAESAGSDGLSAGPCVRALLIDDSRVDRVVVRRALRRMLPDAAVTECDTLESAARRLSEGPVDLVICDDLLPDGRGSEFLVGLDRRIVRVLVSGVSDQAPAGMRFVAKYELGEAELARGVTEAGRLARARGAAMPDRAGPPERVRRDIAQALTRALRMMRSSRLTDSAVPEEERRDRLIQIEGLLLAARDMLDEEHLSGGDLP